jgi:hypothetical protein
MAIFLRVPFRHWLPRRAQDINIRESRNPCSTGGRGFDWALSGGNAILRESKKLVGVAGAAASAVIPKAGDVLSKAQPLLFASVRNQILCIDDLERKGGISVKDVLGLISYLREQRSCKIVLLLNQTKLNEDEASKKDFDEYFEKTIDTRLVFAPSESEAVGIAIEGKDDLSALIRENAIKLRISNIRVIKKIERLVRMVTPVVSDMPPKITEQVVHSLVMFGWRKFDTGAKPPPLDYLATNPIERFMSRKSDGQEVSQDESRWDTIIENYGFNNLDQSDLALSNFVENSVLDTDAILAAAKEVEQRNLRTSAGSPIQPSARDEMVIPSWVAARLASRLWMARWRTEASPSPLDTAVADGACL